VPSLVQRIRRAAACLFAVVLFAHTANAVPPPQRKEVDVCVYGGTSAGVIASVAAKREGKSVVLVEPGRHLGGMSSGGLGWTDFGNKAVIGGMSLDFYRRIGRAYGRKDAVWTFEPHVAENAFRDLVAENNLDVLFEHRVVSAQKGGTRLASIKLEHAPPLASSRAFCLLKPRLQSHRPNRRKSTSASTAAPPPA